MQDIDKERFNIIILGKYIVQEEVCSGVKMLEDSFWSGSCKKGYPTPKGRDSDSCKYFVKG